MKLMNLCELKSIDPESISDISKALLDEQINERMKETLLKFLIDDTKFYYI